jgi:hypothetical protein
MTVSHASRHAMGCRRRRIAAAGQLERVQNGIATASYPEFVLARGASQRLQPIRLVRFMLGDSGVPYDWE